MGTVTKEGRGGIGMLVALALVGLLSGCVATEPTPGTMAPPSGVELVALDASHDFGTVPNGPVVTHTFKLKNYGPDTIQITGVQSACGCTAVLASTPELGAGDEGGVEVALDTYKLAGEQSKTITVKSSDPIRPELPLTLHGTVATDLKAAPARLYLGHLPAGAVVSQYVDVTLARPDVQVTGVSSESGRFSLETTPLDPPAHGVRVRVTLLPTSDTGTFDDRIVVSSNSTTQPTITIPVLGAIERQEAYARRRAESTATR
jgi:hypothetical protein